MNPVVLDALVEQVVQAVRCSASDFRTVDSLASQLGCSRGTIAAAITQGIAQHRLRRPVAAGQQYREWVRCVEAGLTFQEKWARLTTMAGRGR